MAGLISPDLMIAHFSRYSTVYQKKNMKPYTCRLMFIVYSLELGRLTKIYPLCLAQKHVLGAICVVKYYQKGTFLLQREPSGQGLHGLN